MSNPQHEPDHARAQAAREGDIDLTLFGDEHIARYEETDGEVGYLWNGAPILILHTTGHATGLPRKHALIFGRDGRDVVVVASKGGADDHPSWYRNLDANSAVAVQILGERYDAVAHTADPEERARLWPMMAELWPSYDDYQAATDREIPVVVISPII